VKGIDMARPDESEPNPFAAPETDLAFGAEVESAGKMVYANFGQRFVAAFVDGILVNILGAVFSFPAGLALGATLGADAQNIAPIVGGLIGLCVGWLYSALQESSESRATLGKKMMGLKVVDLSGGQISFMQATGRHFGKLVSLATCMVGYLMQPFTEKKQALHDMMASTLVIKS
jgi:uncharacterized RDD family membrane protein YckC